MRYLLLFLFTTISYNTDQFSDVWYEIDDVICKWVYELMEMEVMEVIKNTQQDLERLVEKYMKEYL